MSKIRTEEDVPAHKKKKASDVSKAKEKAKHKHEYVDCLFICNGMPHKGKYCKKCGKINNITFFDIVDGKMLTGEKIFEMYKDFEKFTIDDIFQKYIPINT